MKKIMGLFIMLFMLMVSVSTVSAKEWKWGKGIINKFNNSFTYQVDFKIDGYDDFEQVIICNVYAVHIMPNGEVIYRCDNPNCTEEYAFKHLVNYPVNFDSEWTTWSKNYQCEEHWQ